MTACHAKGTLKTPKSPLGNSGIFFGVKRSPNSPPRSETSETSETSTAPHEETWKLYTRGLKVSDLSEVSGMGVGFSLHGTPPVLMAGGSTRAPSPSTPRWLAAALRPSDLRTTNQRTTRRTASYLGPFRGSPRLRGAE